MQGAPRSGELREARTIGPMPPETDGDEEDADVQALMWHDAGLVRSAEGLARGVSRLEAIARSRETALASGHGTHDAWRRANLARVGALIARAALWREESRGGHRRTDFPERDDLNWKIHGSAKLEVLSAK